MPLDRPLNAEQKKEEQYLKRLAYIEYGYEFVSEAMSLGYYAKKEHRDNKLGDWPYLIFMTKRDANQTTLLNYQIGTAALWVFDSEELLNEWLDLIKDKKEDYLVD